MAENSIVRNKDELVSHGDGLVDPEYRKILEVVPGMEGFDINGMLAKLMQYVNMSDALSHVEKTLEYVVQIPIKHRDAFKAGEVLSIRTQKLVLCGLLYMKHWKMEKESLWIIFLLNRRRLFMETRSKVLLSVITIYICSSR